PVRGETCGLVPGRQADPCLRRLPGRSLQGGGPEGDSGVCDRLRAGKRRERFRRRDPLIFLLRGFPSKTPVASLGGGRIRYKPVTPTTVTGPSGQENAEILIDTGADDVVFPLDMARRLGITLPPAPQGQARGVGSQQSVALFFAPVILQLQ